MDADPFWDIQYLEQTERRFGIGVTRDVVGQYGRWSFSEDKVDRQDINLGISQVHGSCDVCAKPTPWRRCTIILVLPQLRSQGDTPV